MLDRLNKTELIDYLDKRKGTVVSGFNIELVDQYALPNNCKCKKYVVLDNNNSLFGEKESLTFTVVDSNLPNSSKCTGIISRVELVVDGINYNLTLLTDKKYSTGTVLLEEFLASMNKVLNETKTRSIKKLLLNILQGK